MFGFVLVFLFVGKQNFFKQWFFLKSWIFCISKCTELLIKYFFKTFFWHILGEDIKPVFPHVISSGWSLWFLEPNNNKISQKRNIPIQITLLSSYLQVWPVDTTRFKDTGRNLAQTPFPVLWNPPPLEHMKATTVT